MMGLSELSRRWHCVHSRSLRLTSRRKSTTWGEKAMALCGLQEKPLQTLLTAFVCGDQASPQQAERCPHTKVPSNFLSSSSCCHRPARRDTITIETGSACCYGELLFATVARCKGLKVLSLLICCSNGSRGRCVRARVCVFHIPSIVPIFFFFFFKTCAPRLSRHVECSVTECVDSNILPFRNVKSQGGKYFACKPALCSHQTMTLEGWRAEWSTVDGGFLFDCTAFSCKDILHLC